MACGGTGWVFVGACGVIVGCVPVGAPLPDIAPLVERAIGSLSGGEGVDRGQAREPIVLAPMVGCCCCEAHAPGP